MWIIVCRDSKKDSLVIEITRIILDLLKQEMIMWCKGTKTSLENYLGASQIIPNTKNCSSRRYNSPKIIHNT